MIRRLRLQNFKSLREVDLAFGPLNVFVGPNGSGKSNLVDALEELAGQFYGLAKYEDVEGGRNQGAIPDQRLWARNRDGNIAFKDSCDFLIEAHLYGGRSPYRKGIARLRAYETIDHPNEQPYFDAVREVSGFASQRMTPGRIGSEGAKSLAHRGVDSHELARKRLQIRMKAAFRKRANPSNGADERQRLRHLLKEFEAIRAPYRRACEVLLPLNVFDLHVPRLREYAQKSARFMSHDGEGFGAVVAAICKDPKLKADYLSWLQELGPMEISDVYAKPGAHGDVLFAIKEGDQEYTAGALSDGTLRFAALVAAFFQPRPPKHLLIEEVENGISPHRLRVLVELLRSQSSGGGPQVFVTTHSPLLLVWLTDEEHRHTFYFHRDPATGESVVRPVTEIEGFSEAIRSSTLGDLLAEGWMEAVL